MTNVSPILTDARLRRRNRIAATVIILVALLSAVSGTLFLRHYGFNTGSASSGERYH
jgi:hypothetical protein